LPGGGDAADARVRWKDVCWDDVLDGHTTAPFYYMRSGLVRKDLLLSYAGTDAPATLVVASVRAVVAAVMAGNAPDAAFVLKKAAGSNADGIVFFARAQVSEVQRSGRGGRAGHAGHCLHAAATGAGQGRAGVGCLRRGRPLHPAPICCL
jgi:hypothetical protein